MAQWTSDTFFNGGLHVYQDREGYRFSIDAAIVAAGVRPKPSESIIDLGTGCGIIALILAFRHSSVKLIGIEIQDELVKLADANIRHNRLEHRISLVCGDARRLGIKDVAGPADWVVCNPPYRRPRSGRVNPRTQKALARHEINITLKDIVQAARRFLRNGGQFVTIYPAERTGDLLKVMHEEGIEPKWLRSIHSHQGDDAKLICVKGRKAGRPGLIVHYPLVIYEQDGAYTGEAQRLLQP
jgi:tRNA1Val (adenine37-N6)-methyltransferase